MEENHSEVHNFYQALYHSQGFREMDELLDVVQPKVSDLMNEDLDKLYTEEEVKSALFQMAPLKALGVDGFTVGFFQRH
jgi:predicted XRE-type DNA-binding protein